MYKYEIQVFEVFKNGIGLSYTRIFESSKYIKNKTIGKKENNKRYFITIQYINENEIEELRRAECERRKRTTKK